MNLEQIVKETVAKIVAEKKGKDLTGDGKIDSADYLKARSNAIEKATMKNEGDSEDHEVSMAQRSLNSILRSAMELKAKIGNQEINIPAWIQDHITNSENFIDQASQGYHEYSNGGEEMNEETNDTPYKQGEAANKAHKHYTLNPYPKGSKEYDDFYNGWMNAETASQMAHDEFMFRKERGMDEAFQPKSSFDDYSIGDNVTVAGKKAKITAMKMDDETGERRARVRFEDDSVKDVNINSLDEVQESNDDKIAKYEKYTYTLDGEVVKPEITFLNNILKAMLGNKIYNIGAPENGKVELSPESGKKGMYNEAEDISDEELDQLQATADDTSKMPAERDAARNKIYTSRAKKESQELDEFVVRRWQHYAGIK
jgi:hypothetical protein